MGYERMSVESSSPEDDNRKIENQIMDVQLLKNEFNQALLIEKNGTRNQDELALIMRLPEISHRIINAPVYVTDIPGSSKNENEGRIIQAGHELVFFGKQLSGEVCHYSEDTKLQTKMNDLLDEYLDFIRTRQILTRPGALGFKDVMEDGLINSHIIEQYASRKTLEFIERNKGTMNVDVEFLINTNPIDAADELVMILSSLDEDKKIELENEYKKQEIEIMKDNLRLLKVQESVMESHTFEKLSEEKLPLEAQLIIERNPGLKGCMKRLMRDGSLTLKARTRTSPDVVEAAHVVSIFTQHKFQVNWLEGFIKNGIEPKLTIGDDIKNQMPHKRIELEKTKVKIETLKNQENSPKNESKLSKHQQKQSEIEEFISFVEGDNSEKILREKLALIAESTHGYKEFVMNSLVPLDSQQQEDLQNLNQAIASISREYSLRRIQFDISDEQSSEAQEVVKKLMFIGPIAHGLEHLNLGAFAKLFTSSADDLMGEYAEVKALLGAGYSMNDILKRMKLAAPVFLGASMGAIGVEKLLEQGNDLVAGATFGISAVALSMTTAIQSMKMYKNEFEQLVKEGKIKDPSFIASDPEFKKRLSELFGDVDVLTKEELIGFVEKVLTDEKHSSLFTEDEAKCLIESLRVMDEKALKSLVKRNVDMEAWRRAIEQDFNNPVRLGILIGSASAPIIGMTAASLGLLHNGLVLAGVGSTESMVAGLTVIAARKINEFKWELYLKNELNKLQPIKGQEKEHLRRLQTQSSDL